MPRGHPEHGEQKGHRGRRRPRGGRRVRLDAANYENRNVIDRGSCRMKQWQGLATRYDKHAVINRADVVLNAIVARDKARWTGPSFG